MVVGCSIFAFIVGLVLGMAIWQRECASCAIERDQARLERDEVQQKYEKSCKAYTALRDRVREAIHC